MCIAHRLLHSTIEISDATASMPSPVISLCNIVLHLLVRHTALLRRLSSHSAHSTHFPFSNRFLEVPIEDLSLYGFIMKFGRKPVFIRVNADKACLADSERFIVEYVVGYFREH